MVWPQGQRVVFEGEQEDHRPGVSVANFGWSLFYQATCDASARISAWKTMAPVPTWMMTYGMLAWLWLGSNT